ncbi:YdcF family protein [Enterococcus sp. LJL120]
MTTQSSKLADLNLVLNYLADQPSAKLFAGNKTYPLLILAGNSLPPLTEAAGQLVKEGKVEKILLSGGIGHATQFLQKNYQKIGYNFSKELSEAQMNQLFLIEACGLVEEQLLVENASTNSGENASFSLAVLREIFGTALPKDILLTNDPLLQKRTKATFKFNWQAEASQFENFVPIVPQVKELTEELHFSDSRLNQLWQKDYFWNLVLGEYTRLKDDENGYGPKGKGYIETVGMPVEVAAAFDRLLETEKFNLQR